MDMENDDVAPDFRCAQQDDPDHGKFNLPDLVKAQLAAVEVRYEQRLRHLEAELNVEGGVSAAWRKEYEALLAENDRLRHHVLQLEEENERSAGLKRALPMETSRDKRREHKFAKVAASSAFQDSRLAKDDDKHPLIEETKALVITSPEVAVGEMGTASMARVHASTHPPSLKPSSHAGSTTTPVASSDDDEPMAAEVVASMSSMPPAGVVLTVVESTQPSTATNENAVLSMDPEAKRARRRRKRVAEAKPKKAMKAAKASGIPSPDQA